MDYQSIACLETRAFCGLGAILFYIARCYCHVGDNRRQIVGVVGGLVGGLLAGCFYAVPLEKIQLLAMLAIYKR